MNMLINICKNITNMVNLEFNIRFHKHKLSLLMGKLFSGYLASLFQELLGSDPCKNT